MREILLATMGEMTLKGLNRSQFENTLLKTLRKRLAPLGNWQVRAQQSTIYIEPAGDAEEKAIDGALRVLQVTFGIAALARAAVCEKDLSAIEATAKEYLAGELAAATTFKVASKRADKKFPLTSMELSREVGGALLESYPHLRVDVHDPQLTVVVEVREKAAFVHGGKQRGPGGLPIPTSGRSALLLSGGIDSPVAAYLAAKRGLGLVAIHFASPPYTSPRAAAKVEKLAELLTEYTGPLPYYMVPYTKTQEHLRDKLPRQDYFTVAMRRSMMRIAHAICQKEQCEAVVTGESLAQVASQTLQALACTDVAQPLPVLRPCIGMDKAEIVELARKIGTYETSILPYEDCCTIFTPPHPRTKPKLADIEAMEAQMPDLPALEAEAAQGAEFRLVM